MKLQRFVTTAVFVALLHVAVLSIVFGPWQWKYLLCALLTGAIFWILLPAVLPLRRRAFLITAAIFSFAVQQICFRIWRENYDGVWWPLTQFWVIHGLLFVGFVYFRDRRSSTFVWRGTMLKK